MIAGVDQQIATSAVHMQTVTRLTLLADGRGVLLAAS